MTRSELVERLMTRNPHFHVRECDAAVRTIFDVITDALIRGDRVELRDFGSFALNPRDARESRNPRSGARVSVPAKNAVKFKPGKGMQKRLNEQR